MSILYFGRGRDLKIDIGAPIAIQQGAGLHRLILPVSLLAMNKLSAGIPLGVTGCAWLSMAGMEWLGNWQTDRPLVTRTFEFDGQIVLPLTDDQLAVIEQKRSGREIRILFDTDVVLHDPTTPDGWESDADRWPVKSFQHNIQIYAETWERMLTQTSIALSMALVVAVPLDASPAAKVGAHLRDAIRKVNEGEYADAVTAARRAIDSMNTEWVSEKAAIQPPKFERSWEERLSALRHALHTLASPSAHGDDVADSIDWDREKALAVIAGVSALAATAK